MKRQEVNFYLPEFSSKTVYLSFFHACFVSLLFIIFLTVQYVFEKQQLTTLQQQTTDVRLQSQSADAIGLLADQLQIKKQQLEREIKKQSEEIANKQYISQIYTKSLAESQLSIANLFIGLSQSAVEGISLSKIEIYNQGHELLLSGYAINKKTIPDYLAKLKSHEHFTSSRFGLLVIDRMQDRNIYQFNMQRHKSDG